MFNNLFFSMNSFCFVYFESIHRSSLAPIRYVACVLKDLALSICDNTFCEKCC